MVTSANATIVGTVVRGGPGRIHVESDGRETMSDTMLNLELRVDQLVAGQVGPGRTVTLTLGPYPTDEFGPHVWVDLIGRRVLVSLRRVGVAIPGLREENPAALAWNVYYEVVDVFRDAARR